MKKGETLGETDKRKEEEIKGEKEGDSKEREERGRIRKDGVDRKRKE